MKYLILGIIFFVIACVITLYWLLLHAADDTEQPFSDYKEPQDDPEYQKMVEELALQCTCTGADKPCDGLLAGGLCDDMHQERLHIYPQERQFHGDPDVDANDD